MADLSLDFQFKSPIDKVWNALTNPDILAQWVMENNFQPIVGYRCQFRNEAIGLIVDSEVLVVDRAISVIVHMDRWSDRHGSDLDIEARGWNNLLAS